MSELNPVEALLKKNAAWAKARRGKNPEFFSSLAKQQQPEYLWIGCSDSRVPPNSIMDLAPGEIFVHRNIANMIIPSDQSLLSTVQFAVQALEIKHIIVCGHYGCGGVKAAYENTTYGVLGHWLQDIKDTHSLCRQELATLTGVDEKIDRLCELNVINQVKRLGNTAIIRQTWRQGQPLAIHGWIYNLNNGLLKDLQTTLDSPNTPGDD